MEQNKKVLVTGISGFLGLHLTILLLNKGYTVVGTVRDLKKETALRRVIDSQTVNGHLLTIQCADLMDKDQWTSLTKRIDYIQHVASPFPRRIPKKQEDLILPARQGTLNILEAAISGKVKRVVMTSSLASITYGKVKAERQGPFNETHWSDPSSKKDNTPYYRSKTIAEKAAWEYMQKHPSQTEFCTICPGAILGPVLETDYGTSAGIVVKLMDGSTPFLPNIGFDIVDVRSVAELLVLAMEHPAAAGQRFIASSGYLTFKDISKILANRYPDRKLPKSVMNNTLTRIFSIFEPALRPVLLDVGIKRIVDASKANKVLGWQPINKQSAVTTCAESLLELNIIK